jgi:hypothetical protein
MQSHNTAGHGPAVDPELAGAVRQRIATDLYMQCKEAEK